MRVREARGFTLVEVVVALIVLQVGILTSLGVLVLATRTMARAQVLERVAWRVSAVRDSLAAVDGVVAGQDSVDAVRVSWTPTATGFALVVEGDGVPPFRITGERAWR